MGVLAAVTTLVTFAPWGSSGDRARSSYEIVDVAERAGVLPGSWAAVASAWYLVPVACGLVLIAIALGTVRLAAFGGGTLGAFVVAGGVLVVRSPLGLEVGAVAGIVAGGCTVLAAVVAAAAAHSAGREDERPMGSDQRR